MWNNINVGDLVHWMNISNEFGVVIAKEEKGEQNINGWCDVYWQDSGKVFGTPEHHLRKVKRR
jgi:hypothetical protein